MINWEIIGLITWLVRQQPRHILDTKDNTHTHNDNVGVGVRVIERKLQLSPINFDSQPESHSNEDATDVLPSVSLTAVARNV